MHWPQGSLTLRVTWGMRCPVPDTSVPPATTCPINMDHVADTRGSCLSFSPQCSPGEARLSASSHEDAISPSPSLRMSLICPKPGPVHCLPGLGMPLGAPSHHQTVLRANHVRAPAADRLAQEQGGTRAPPTGPAPLGLQGARSSRGLSPGSHSPGLTLVQPERCLRKATLSLFCSNLAGS